MRRYVFIIGMLLSQLPCATLLLTAQESAEAAPAPAVHQDAEEAYKGLTARMEDLAASNEALQMKLNKLRDEVQKLSDEVARANDKSKDAATMESIKALKSAIEEVDKKRIEDQKLVLEKLEAFKKILDKPITVPRVNPASSGTGDTTPKVGKKPDTQSNARIEKPDTNKPADTGKPENGYNYSIQDGDYLAKIVSKLNKQGIKVSQKQIMDANPGVNWNKLKVNQVIFIPAPQ